MCTGVRAAGDPGVLHVVTVVLLPVAMGTLIQEELVSGALHGVQQDRSRTLTEVSPRPRLRYTAARHAKPVNFFLCSEKIHRKMTPSREENYQIKKKKMGHINGENECLCVNLLLGRHLLLQ